MSHYVPTKEGNVSRIKTGYEKIVAHRTKLPFAYAAEEDGSISNIDQESKILIVKYKSGKTRAVNFGEEYFNNGGGGFYTTQSVVINNFKKGDKVKKGDIIIYNDKFFKPDIYSKQVEWKIGVLANVALIDCGTTMEDSSVLTPKISKQLEFEPVHVRDIVLKKDTRVHKYASIGTELLSTDILLAFDESEMTDDMFGGIDETAVDLLTKLNRITPKAKFTGKVVKIEAYHKCNTDEMSKSIRAIVNSINKPKELKEELTKNCDNSDSFHSHSKVVQSDRIGLNDITDDNIILRFYIQQKTDMNAGDKLVVDSSLKSIPCSVLSGEIDVEDKSTTVDVLFSARSQSARIIMSPLIQGTFNKILEETEQRVIDMYFN